MVSLLQSPRRLVLFDIDGTLLFGGPLWKECFIKAFNQHLPGVEFPKVSFSGKTDLQICREIMASCGFDQNKIEEHMIQIGRTYVEFAKKEAPCRAHEVQVLPGVRPLLDELSRSSDVLLGLLTGNVRAGAFAKLSCVSLSHYFKIGVFGDDHWDRYKLPQLAVERVHETFGIKFSGKQIVIIGDTVHDVNCGKSIGARSIAVGTGRNIPMEDLLAQNPDFYFKDLSQTFEVIQAIHEEIL